MNFWDRLVDPKTIAQEAWVWDGTRFLDRTYGTGVDEARHIAAGLRKRGIKEGSIVAAIVSNGPDALAGFLGVWFAGATAVSLPIIARGMSVPNYLAQLGRLCSLVGADYLLIEERFQALLPDTADLGVEMLGYRSLIDTPEVSDITPPSLDETVIIQFSSGTTGEPRGVELSGRAIEAQVQALAERVQIDPERDIGYTWLPMSHDMGLFGCLLVGWYTGTRGVVSGPERFMQSPRSWFDDCADFGATLAAGPPFAYDVAARLEQARPGATPLKLRLCLVGAEQVSWETLTKTAEAFAPRGLKLEAFTPAYGLAEATLAVTLEDLAVRPSFVDVDGDALASGTITMVDAEDPSARRLVSVGTPVMDTEVRTDPDSHEIIVKSPSLGSGYFGNPQLTEERFQDGELRTADVGFIQDGRLYITGRTDDLLIVGGRNVYVQDLETRLSGHEGVRTGNCALVDSPAAGRARIALIAEVESETVDTGELARSLRRATMEDSGLPVDDFVFLPRGTFPRMSRVA